MNFPFLIYIKNNISKYFITNETFQIFYFYTLFLHNEILTYHNVIKTKKKILIITKKPCLHCIYTYKKNNQKVLFLFLNNKIFPIKVNVTFIQNFQ